MTIASPASGDTVAGTITVRASVTIIGSLLVGGVQFKLDGSNLGPEDTASPYEVSWDTTRVGNGSHTLSAIARDLLGVQYASDPVTVTVSNGPPPDTTPPTVSITSPGSGATVSGTVPINASASDNVGVVGVQFFVDGNPQGSEDTTSPYSVSWDTTTAGNGSHTLTARARDAAGNTAPSAGVTVTVSNGPPPDTTPPDVSITSPAAGGTVSGTVAIDATASDNVGVAGVQFFVDGNPQGSEDTTSPYSVSWDTTTAGNGSHTLTARARDAAGNTRTSAGVTVTVSNGPPPETVRFEETAATLAPAGAWTDLTDASASATLSGGRGVFASTAGASATFAFNGTGVTWIGLPCEICGTARVLLDGAVAATVDTFTPARPAASTGMFTATGLAAGDHTLVIEVTGGQNPSSGGTHVVVDAFDVEGSTGPPPASRIEESDPSVVYTGAWTAPIFRDDLSGGSVVEAAEAGSTASLTFNGTGVSWIGFRGPWAGIAEVRLDGVLAATVDTYGPTEEAQVVMYTATGLAAGAHTIEIRVTGTFSASSVSAWVVLDAFDLSSDGGGGGGGTADTTPPTVNITSPAGGATVSGTVTIDATAWDNVGVSGVQFLADGAAIGTEDRIAPYSASWDTSRVPDGPHTLTAVARDAAGNSRTSAPVTVTVSNGAPAARRSEEDAATLAPPAAWFGLTSAQAGVTLSGDFAVLAADAGATATFAFTGTGVSWIGFECEQCGIATVRLDGAVVATVDTYAPSRPAASGVMYSTPALASGGHTLVIEVTGGRNAASGGPFVAVDAFDVR